MADGEWLTTQKPYREESHNKINNKTSPRRNALRVGVQGAVATDASKNPQLCAVLCGLGLGSEFILDLFAVKLFDVPKLSAVISRKA